ncbi:alpha/beta fold hydrolase [Halosolutus gelatinilyticus]|uniref:alpha/beta fold hydrolase n=1 Tax=Halosolutus gelatinilyticus TaxID=2931975 RepID=UPI001FF3112F|nr:alpha/beta hydrolase [Halosolutus gelatinilyticus]
MAKRDTHSTRAGTVRSEDGTTIAFERTGAGDPILLVGGALTDRSASAPLAAHLAPQFSVYAYDRRGRGDSGDAESYVVEREVEDLEALVEEAGGSAFVFGKSSGAVLALEAAARGLDISKLALYEPPFRVDEGGPRPPADLAARVEDRLSDDRRGDAVELFLTKAVGMPADAVAEMRNEPTWPAIEETAPTLVYDLTVVGDGALPTDRLESVAVPTLAIDGTESPAWARHATRAVADALPDARYRSLAGQTHNIAPDALAPVVAELFAR